MTNVLFDPAAAVAAGHCLTARSVDPERRTTSVHPRRCAWCEYSADELARMVDGFNVWSGYRERTRTYERHDVRIFVELPAARQQELVIAAQGFEFAVEPPTEEPVTAAPTPAAHEPVEPPSAPEADGQANQEDVVAWLS
jgi:hypothetical protein